MYKIKINHLSPFILSQEFTLLENMERAGIKAEYHCRDGHCGACRCRLVSGEVEEIGVKLAYTDKDEILPCICKAKSDLILAGVDCQINDTPLCESIE